MNIQLVINQFLNHMGISPILNLPIGGNFTLIFYLHIFLWYVLIFLVFWLFIRIFWRLSK